MHTTRTLTILERITVAYMVACCCAMPSRGGSSGSYTDYYGNGKAVANIYLNGVLRSSSTSSYTKYPSTSTSSSGASCSVQGQPYGFISCSTSGTGSGVSADSDDLNALNLPTTCSAELDVFSSAKYDTNGFSGVFRFVPTMTVGTAILLRGYEYTGTKTAEQIEQEGVANNPGAPDHSYFVDILKTDTLHSTLLFEKLVIGPYPQTGDDCVVMTDFTSTTGVTNVYFVVDALAKTQPLTINCGVNGVLELGCSSSGYPPATVTGYCGATVPPVVYSPKASELVSGQETTVTATATDANGNTATCSFQAKRTGLTVSCNPVLNFGCAAAADLKYPDNFVTVSGACNPTYTVTYSPYQNAKDLPIGDTLITATVNDGVTTAQCTFTATRSLVEFGGFTAPIAGAGGGTCPKPVKTVSWGSNIPFKFTEKCQGGVLSTGRPHLNATECVSDTPVPIFEGDFAFVANEWHIQVDTGKVPPPPRGKVTVYKFVVTLQDGVTKPTVYIGVK